MQKKKTTPKQPKQKEKPFGSFRYTIEQSSEKECPDCMGTGYDPYDGGQCERCAGTGMVSR